MPDLRAALVGAEWHREIQNQETANKIFSFSRVSAAGPR